VVAVVLGAVGLLVSVGLVLGGAALAFVDQTQREDGFLMTDRTGFGADGHAVVSEAIELHDPTWLPLPARFLGDARIVVEGSGADVFVGVASTDDVDRYLAGVGHATVVDLEGNGLSPDPEYRVTDGGPPSAPPAQVDIWEASASGPGEQTLTWDVESGDWSVVLMNADGTAPVEVEAGAGATLPGLGWVAGGLVIAGAVGLLLALGLLGGALLAGRGRSGAGQ
jgi:hypothetical protein